MGQPISRQHPAVVLRSHYQHMRSLLAAALIAVVALSATVVILATEEDGDTGTTVSSESFGSTAGFQNRPDEGTVAQSLSTPRTPPTAASRPDESAVASAISTPDPPLAVARPDESKIAASIALGQQRGTGAASTQRPDESTVGSSIHFRRQWPNPPSNQRPDEGTVAQAVSGR